LQSLVFSNPDAVDFDPLGLEKGLDIDILGVMQGQQGQQAQQGQQGQQELVSVQPQADVNRKLETQGALSLYAGFTKFRPGQQEALISLLEQRDTVANLPTGSGKSLIYQLLALMTRQAVLVITPTVALVEDQVKNLNVALKAASTGSANGASREILSGEFDVIFINPEWLWPAEGVSNVTKIAALHEKRSFAAVVIDEAHLVLRWASFRKGFDQLLQLKEHLPKVPTLLMTATLKKADITKLAEKVGLQHPKVVRVSMTRDNINLKVNQQFLLKAKQNFHEHTLPPTKVRYGRSFDEILREQKVALEKGRCFLYVDTIANAKETTKKLKLAGIGAEFVVGVKEMTAPERKQAIEKWEAGTAKVLVGTDAMGVGINQDVRLVIIIGLPQDIESLWQKVGRAGRVEGLQAAAVLYWQLGDLQSVGYKAANAMSQQQK